MKQLTEGKIKTNIKCKITIDIDKSLPPPSPRPGWMNMNMSRSDDGTIDVVRYYATQGRD